MRITYEQLKSKKPCASQFKIYCKNYPDNWKVTKAGCMKASSLGLNLYWFVVNFLPAPALKAYNKAVYAAWKAYVKATTPAQKAYDEATVIALKAFDEATATARETYNEATAPAWKTYVKAKAITLWEVIQKGEK